MKRYYFTVEITAVTGSQIFYVDAENEEAAHVEVTQGGGIFVDEEFSVDDLGVFELTCVEDIPKEKK